MRHPRWAGLALVVLTAAGCGSAATSPSTTNPPSHLPSAHRTATEESRSWFEAINAKDRPASVAYFAPQDRDLGDWDGGDVTQWPTFTAVHCKPLGAATATSASTFCTFRSHGDPSSEADTFWTIEFTRTAGGPWLITNYGQG